MIVEETKGVTLEKLGNIENMDAYGIVTNIRDIFAWGWNANDQIIALDNMEKQLNARLNSPSDISWVRGKEMTALKELTDIDNLNADEIQRKIYMIDFTSADFFGFLVRDKDKAFTSIIKQLDARLNQATNQNAA